MLYSLQGGAGYNAKASSPTFDYLLCIFKGFNIISAQNYEQVTPEIYSELVLSVFFTLLQIILFAYIVGARARPPASALAHAPCRSRYASASSLVLQELSPTTW